MPISNRHFITAINNKSSNIFAIVNSESVDSDIFPLNGYPRLIRKDSITHMHGLAVFMKDGVPFVRDNLLEILDDRSIVCMFLVCFT